jgi:hypothetical protein
VSQSSKRRPALLWAGAGLLVALAIVVFFAVRGGGGSGGSSNAIVEAAEMTEREPGGHLTFHSTVSEPRLQAEKWSGAMVFDSTDATTGIVRTSSPDLGGSTVLQVIADGDSFYSRPDGLPPRKGRKWVGFGYAVGEETDELNFVGADAARELRALGEATDVVVAGTGKVRGVETARYRGRAPGLGRVEVWIDGKDRVRRLRVMSLKTKVGATGEATAMTVDFFDFGPVPEITPPPRQDVSSVLESAKREFDSHEE